MSIFDISNCTLCPRLCGVDRRTHRGFCGEGQEMRVSKIMLHRWEEPCISGNDPERGSGAVFFSGCSLRCVYCQNKDISRGGTGEIYTPEMLSEAMKNLCSKGAYNINFVTPTHFYHKIKETLDIYRPDLPVVFNTSGYERAQTVAALSDYADIFLTDFKYGTDELAKSYSNAGDYPALALRALWKMIEVTGGPELSEDGMMKKGVIVRHLVLPGGRRDSVKALKLICDAVGAENVLLSLMSQYTPEFAPEDMKVLRRKTTTFEYEYVRDCALEMGFSGFGQDRESATRAYTPDFI